jgi:hypothetical protein
MPSKSNPAGQRILLLSKEKSAGRNGVTDKDFDVVEQQNALAKRVLLKETCSSIRPGPFWFTASPALPATT